MNTLLAILRLGLLLVGTAILVSGCDEIVVSTGVSQQPVPIGIEELEQGAVPPDGHLRIGPHIRVFNRAYITYLKTDPVSSTPADETRVISVRYPILGTEHPFALALEQELTHFAVLVQDDSYETLGQIPKEPLRGDWLEGLVISDIVRWTDEQRRLLGDLFPGVDLENLIVIEKDRQPETPFSGVLRLLAGAALMLLSIFWVRLLRALRPRGKHGNPGRGPA